MGFLDKAKEQADKLLGRTNLDEKATQAWEQHGDKVTDAVDQHADRIDQGIDRATDVVSEKTGGRFDGKIQEGADKVREGLDGLDGKADDFGPAAGEGDKA